MEFIRSLRTLMWNVVRRFYVLLPGLIFGAVDVGERVADTELVLPSWITWSLLGWSVFFAVAWAYHDLRMESVKGESKSVSADVLGLILDALRITEGPQPSTADDRDARDKAWHDDAAAFVQKAFGPAEKSIFTATVHAKSYDALVDTYRARIVDLVRRLPEITIRASQAELERAREEWRERQP